MKVLDSQDHYHQALRPGNCGAPLDYGKEESHNSFEHNWWQEAKGRGHVKMKDFLHEFNEGFLKVIPRFLEELMVENSWRTGLTFTGQDVSKEGRGL